LSNNFPLDHIDIDSSVNFSSSVLYLAENRMWDTVFLSLETGNWYGCWDITWTFYV